MRARRKLRLAHPLLLRHVDHHHGKVIGHVVAVRVTAARNDHQHRIARAAVVEAFPQVKYNLFCTLLGDSPCLDIRFVERIQMLVQPADCRGTDDTAHTPHKIEKLHRLKECFRRPFRQYGQRVPHRCQTGFFITLRIPHALVQHFHVPLRIFRKCFIHIVYRLQVQVLFLCFAVAHIVFRNLRRASQPIFQASHTHRKMEVVPHADKAPVRKLAAQNRRVKLRNSRNHAFLRNHHGCRLEEPDRVLPALFDFIHPGERRILYLHVPDKIQHKAGDFCFNRHCTTSIFLYLKTTLTMFRVMKSFFHATDVTFYYACHTENSTRRAICMCFGY